MGHYPYLFQPARNIEILFVYKIIKIVGRVRPGLDLSLLKEYSRRPTSRGAVQKHHRTFSAPSSFRLSRLCRLRITNVPTTAPTSKSTVVNTFNHSSDTSIKILSDWSTDSCYSETTQSKAVKMAPEKLTILLAVLVVLIVSAQEGAAVEVAHDVRANWRARCKSRRDTCYHTARVSAGAAKPNPNYVYNACCSCYYACHKSRRYIYRKDCLNVKRAWASGTCSKNHASTKPVWTVNTLWIMESASPVLSCPSFGYPPLPLGLFVWQ